MTMSPMLFGEPESNTGALRWLSPALIGLCAPISFGLMLFPGAMDNARGVLLAVLFVLLLVCVGVYALSVVNPGAPVSLAVDRSMREIDLTSSGTFASKHRTIAFEDISNLYMRKHYDDDGYALEVGELRLKDGEVLALPASMTAADIEVARRAIGLSSAQPTRRR